MAQVTIDMCNHIIAAADRGERFPLTANELRQLAYSFRAKLEDPLSAVSPDLDRAIQNELDHPPKSIMEGK